MTEIADGSNGVDKDALLKKLVLLKEKIEALGGYGGSNPQKLVNLCNEFEATFSDLCALDENNIQVIAFGYGEDVRRDSEWSTKTPTRKMNESFLADRYDRGKRHLIHEVNLFIFKLNG